MTDRELLKLWRGLVREGGVPRYTVLPGAALNTLVTWTDRALASGTLTEGGDVEQAPSDSLSGPTAESRDAQ